MTDYTPEQIAAAHADMQAVVAADQAEKEREALVESMTDAVRAGAEHSARARAPHLFNGEFERHLNTITKYFSPSMAAAAARDKRAETITENTVTVADAAPFIAAATLMMFADDVRDFSGDHLVVHVEEMARAMAAKILEGIEQ